MKMAASTSVIFAAFLFCFSTVAADDVVNLQALINSTKATLQKANTHVDHMLNLDPLPNREQISAIVKAESGRLADSFKQLAATFEEKRQDQENQDLKTLMWSTAFALKECADNLTHSGASDIIRDIKKDNELYFRCGSTALHFAGRITTLWDLNHRDVPCGLPICQNTLKTALRDLDGHIKDYESGVHTAVGPHGSTQGHEEQDHGHHHHHH